MARDCRAWYLTEHEHCPTPEEVDEDEDCAISVIDGYVDDVETAANNWVSDAAEWGKVAKARIEARAKAKKKPAKKLAA